MQFIIAIESPEVPSECFGVIVPDLLGCYSAGETRNEVIENSKEAIGLHLEGMEENGMDIPAQRSMEELQNDPEYSNMDLVVVEV